MEIIEQGALEVGFVREAAAGHVFFYDTETDEVVHFREEIYQAAKAHDLVFLSKLEGDEVADGRDAKEVVNDLSKRYVAGPIPSAEEEDEWRAAFDEFEEESPGELGEWSLVRAEKYNEMLMDWLDSIEPDETVRH